MSNPSFNSVLEDGTKRLQEQRESHVAQLKAISAKARRPYSEGGSTVSSRRIRRSSISLLIRIVRWGFDHQTQRIPKVC